MPYSTLVSGTTITASWANANVRDQVITPFASAAARASAITSPVEGMATYQTDTDTLDLYDGAAWKIGLSLVWTSFTGNWTAASVNPTIGNGTKTAFYVRMGRTVFAKYKIVMGSTSTYGTGQWYLDLPFTANTTGEAGSLRILDSGTANRAGTCFVHDTPTRIAMIVGAVDVISTQPQAWAVADELEAFIVYEASS